MIFFFRILVEITEEVELFANAYRESCTPIGRFVLVSMSDINIFAADGYRTCISGQAGIPCFRVGFVKQICIPALHTAIACFQGYFFRSHHSHNAVKVVIIENAGLSQGQRRTA